MKTYLQLKYLRRWRRFLYCQRATKRLIGLVENYLHNFSKRKLFRKRLMGFLNSKDVYAVDPRLPRVAQSSGWTILVTIEDTAVMKAILAKIKPNLFVMKKNVNKVYKEFRRYEKKRLIQQRRKIRRNLIYDYMTSHPIDERGVYVPGKWIAPVKSIVVAGQCIQLDFPRMNQYDNSQLTPVVATGGNNQHDVNQYMSSSHHSCSQEQDALCVEEKACCEPISVAGSKQCDNNLMVKISNQDCPEYMALEEVGVLGPESPQENSIVGSQAGVDLKCADGFKSSKEEIEQPTVIPSHRLNLSDLPKIMIEQTKARSDSGRYIKDTSPNCYVMGLLKLVIRDALTGEIRMLSQPINDPDCFVFTYKSDDYVHAEQVLFRYLKEASNIERLIGDMITRDGDVKRDSWVYACVIEICITYEMCGRCEKAAYDFISNRDKNSFIDHLERVLSKQYGLQIEPVQRSSEILEPTEVGLKILMRVIACKPYYTIHPRCGDYVYPCVVDPCQSFNLDGLRNQCFIQMPLSSQAIARSMRPQLVAREGLTAFVMNNNKRSKGKRALFMRSRERSDALELPGYLRL